MPNPMMEMLNRSARPNNPLQMVAEFRKFAKSMTPQKAEQQIKQMLSDGRLSNEQFQSLQEQAKQFMQFLK